MFKWRLFLWGKRFTGSARLVVVVVVELRRLNIFSTQMVSSHGGGDEERDEDKTESRNIEHGERMKRVSVSSGKENPDV